MQTIKPKQLGAAVSVTGYDWETRKREASTRSGIEFIVLLAHALNENKRFHEATRGQRMAEACTTCRTKDILTTDHQPDTENCSFFMSCRKH